MSYFKDTYKGLSWMTAFRIMYRVIGIVRISIIAHLLSPYGLGVFAVATISLGFLEIITETGINVFLIQEKEEIEKYINTAWVVSIFRGLFISFLIFISAGYVAKFFNSPESQSLLYLVCFVPLIRGFINPSIVKFQKNLAFNKEFLYRVSVFFVESSFSIVGAFVTKSPLGLIWGLIGGAVYEVIFTFFVVEPRPKLIFELSKIKRVISRGKWLTLFGIFDYVYTTFDNVIVGRMLGVGLLGIYQNAYKISTTPLTEVGDIFFRVTFPFFSKISDDKERLQESFLKNTIVTTVLMTAAGIFVYVFADPIVRIVLGNGWESAIPVTRLLTILGVTRGIASSTSSFLIAKQKQKYTATVTFVSAIGLLVTIVPLINIYGIMGAGMAAIIGTLISLPLTIYYVKKTFTE